MEQRIGVPRLTPIPGPEGESSFEAPDDDAALTHACDHFYTQVKNCVRAELSSKAIVPGSSGSGTRLVDDALENPHFQEAYIQYDPRTDRLQVDFVSTATGILPAAYKRSAM
jgi:hypothetical protein